MNFTPSWASARVVAPFVVGMLVVAACGGGAPSTDTAAPAAQTQPQPAGAPAATPPAAAPAVTVPAATPPADPAAASALVQEHETGVEVTLVELKRTSGDSLTMRWRYRNTTGAEARLTKAGSSWYDPYRLTGDSFLVDPVNRKKYLVITDAERVPLASKHGDWQGVTLEPGQTLSAWAKFPAPPPEVEKLTVTIAGVPPFEDVPVVK